MALKLSVSLSTDRSTDRVNSAKRFPMGRVWNSAERSLRIAFGTQQNALYGSRSRLKLKAKYHITFLSYNLLTKTENAAGFIQAFLL
ncbi:hypothetical protein [Leptospira interrogans]|uniref:Uncharacterized protein n=2 Tax=Leptospira interrogans TaxID=173 RepID=Q8F2A6_LEPIN|nr:hypothetical protein [Leptospira interrogans]AAN50069.2 hypothetical protein LA_2870 [Leptospira interrogans serovar Lai str. 56601]AER03119.1 hypothetical protein LIF_A2336 [Leptospira interrogans serovar Lai str. IPAV]